jgi:Transposase DDE domain.
MLHRNKFSGKNLIIADRGYESYNVFAHLLEHENVDFLIRVKQDKTAMREIQKLPMTELDRDVAFTITTTQTNADKQNGYIFLQTPSKKGKADAKTRAGRWHFPSPYPMSFRVVRFMLDTGEYETIATSLPRDFTISDIKELYHSRWGIETSFRELKYCIGLVNLHGKKDEFVFQEIYSSLIMYNFCNRISGEVVVRQKKENVYAYKVNLTMAIYLCREFYRDAQGNGEKLMQDIGKYTEPVRQGRRDTRNIKAKSFVGFTYRVAA